LLSSFIGVRTARNHQGDVGGIEMNTSFRSNFLSIAMVVAMLLGLVGVAMAQGPDPQVPAEPQAALGTAFTYQGQLKNASGPINGTCDFQFSLWDALLGPFGQIGTTQLKTGVNVNGGFFAAQLDFGDRAFTGEARWLQIAVKCSGDSDFVTLVPRQVLTPAPYALYAPNSGSTAALQNRAVTAITPTLNQVLKWNGTAWVPANDETESGSGSAWSLTGDVGTNPLTNFLGTTDNVSLTLRVSNTAALRLIPNATSPNLVGGYSGNGINPTVIGATIGGGGSARGCGPAGTSSCANSVSANYGTVSGGRGNVASGDSSTVSGGHQNTASGALATIGGGGGILLGQNGPNVASGAVSTISGGTNNIVTSTHGTIGGGSSNSITGEAAVVDGGASNTASGYHATVGGGSDNVASGESCSPLGCRGGSTVSGGDSNTASSLSATVAGGQSNTAEGDYATVAGGSINTASGDYTAIGGGQAISVSGPYAAVAGGSWITATGSYAAVSGGQNIRVSGNYAAVAGGQWITVTSDYATVGGGMNNIVGGQLGNTIGGGRSNTVSGYIDATINGGAYNTASETGATIGGGWENIAGGSYATVPGGLGNLAQGTHSFAAGKTAQAIHVGSFVWADATGTPFASTGPQQFDVRATGGVNLTVGSANARVNSAPLLPRALPPVANTLTTLDSAGEVGLFTSVTIGADGLGLISYSDATNGDLKVAHCADVACTSATLTTLDSWGDVGRYSSITIGADGLGLISYVDWGNQDLRVAHCVDVACTSATLTTLDRAGDVGWYTSVTIGSDGLGLISYYNFTTGNLKVAHCADVACTSATLTTLDTGILGTCSVTIGADGLPLITYYDNIGGPDQHLKVAHCVDAACTSATLTTLDSAGEVAWYTSVTIGVDGLPLVTYDSDFGPKLAHCADVACTSATLTVLDIMHMHTDLFASSVTIGADGLGLISAFEIYGGLKVAHCADVACTSATLTTLDSAREVGKHSSVTIGADGLPLVSYFDVVNRDLKVAHCANAFCTPYFRRR
jgi:hypothetical protein